MLCYLNNCTYVALISQTLNFSCFTKLNKYQCATVSCKACIYSAYYYLFCNQDLPFEIKCSCILLNTFPPKLCSFLLMNYGFLGFCDLYPRVTYKVVKKIWCIRYLRGIYCNICYSLIGSPLLDTPADLVLGHHYQLCTETKHIAL